MPHKSIRTEAPFPMNPILDEPHSRQGVFNNGDPRMGSAHRANYDATNIAPQLQNFPSTSF